MAQEQFHYEVAETEDENKTRVTVIQCHGRLVSKSVEELKELVKPLIARGGRIVLDFGDLAWMDSSGLGAVVGLKVSTLNKGGTLLARVAEPVTACPRAAEPQQPGAVIHHQALSRLGVLVPYGGATSLRRSAQIAPVA